VELAGCRLIGTLHSFALHDVMVALAAQRVAELAYRWVRSSGVPRARVAAPWALRDNDVTGPDPVGMASRPFPRRRTR
jgi:hypothetical protein